MDVIQAKFDLILILDISSLFIMSGIGTIVTGIESNLTGVGSSLTAIEPSLCSIESPATGPLQAALPPDLRHSAGLIPGFDRLLRNFADPLPFGP